MNEIAVQTTQLTKHFRDFWRRLKVTAVNNLDLTIPGGSVFGILGPNGSGKTTTLKIITGLLHPSAGSVRILGGKPRDRATRQRFGYLPETTGMYPYLNARDMLRLHAGLFGITRTQATQQTKHLLQLVALDSAANRPVGEFSQGMTRRLGLAIALINDPDLLILDEPTAGLDPAGCRLVKDLIRERARDGKTVVIASHLLADIEDICDSACILHHGRLVANGTLSEMLEQREQTRFTVSDLSASDQAALQDAFRTIAGEAADIDHPHMKLETFFENAVQQSPPTDNPQP